MVTFIIIIAVFAIIIIVVAKNFKSSVTGHQSKIQEQQSKNFSIDDVIDPDFPLYADYDDRTFVAVDCETATPDRMICEIGVAVVENGVIVDKADFLIRPPMNEYNSNNIRVHGITPDKTENCPTFKEVWPKIRAMMLGKQIIAHNSAFDIDAINKNLHYYNLPQLQIRSICTSKMLDKIDLVSACAYYKIDMGHHHNALDDAQACALLRLAYLDNPVEGKDIPKIKKHPSAKKLSSTCDLINGNPDSPFYGKTCVITGMFFDWPDRNDLADELIKLGARITGAVSGRTDYLITGYAAGPAKIEKAESLQENGSDIRIIDESELKELL